MTKTQLKQIIKECINETIYPTEIGAVSEYKVAFKNLKEKYTKELQNNAEHLDSKAECAQWGFEYGARAMFKYIEDRKKQISRFTVNK